MKKQKKEGRRVPPHENFQIFFLLSPKIFLYAKIRTNVPQYHDSISITHIDVIVLHESTQIRQDISKLGPLMAGHTSEQSSGTSQYTYIYIYDDDTAGSTMYSYRQLTTDKAIPQKGIKTGIGSQLPIKSIRDILQLQ